ncbi:unnamed protein product [Psylliodes chrysocephalus]|uniref:HMG box domain-containing protein n=1 Tax=Psylliodes chrysocephalus TaxID=3402493 RepID=A0A9P0CET4_9CUCU|nr:unnamed protein product [Psylliodes chrysocephala]
MESNHSATKMTNSKNKITARQAPSKVFRNPFLTFMVDFRRNNKHKLSFLDIIKKGAEMWRNLNENEKQYYIDISKQVPFVRRRRRVYEREIKDKSTISKRKRKRNAQSKCSDVRSNKTAHNSTAQNSKQNTKAHSIQNTKHNSKKNTNRHLKQNTNHHSKQNTNQHSNQNTNRKQSQDIQRRSSSARTKSSVHLNENQQTRNCDECTAVIPFVGKKDSRELRIKKSDYDGIRRDYI